MRTLRLQLGHSPPLVGGVRDDGGCTKRFSSCTYVLWLRQSRKIPANSLSLSTTDCSHSWPMMILTSPRAITFSSRAVSPSFSGLKPEDFCFNVTPVMVALTFASVILSAILVKSVVVLGALVVLLLYLGKGTHNLIAYSGDTTLLSIASLNSVTTMVAVFSLLSLLINKAILGKLLSLRLIEAKKKRIYRLTKQAQA